MAATQIKQIAGLDVRDEFKTNLYDTIELTSTSNLSDERKFFTNTQGKSLVLSNMKGMTTLEAEKSFRIFGVQVDASLQDPAKRELLPLLSNYSYIQLRIGDKDYLEAPLRHVTGKIDHRVALAGDTNAVDSYQQFGCPGANPVMYQGDHTLDVPPLRTFYLLWKIDGMSAGQVTKATPSADFPVRIVAVLKGVMRRVVQ